ncbi:GvpL/GvpF family gas vesicle protein [Pseudonocardia sp. MH-G8]|uniref:GvpL/GvpF family gas vesicle protein n=1 Tax=Pseudonocardia sp. MH-G8 TaxID=1854588 RepID=UPI000BA01D4D|nr:GvpL/GvpF family gas vesicle protein [Pseudonocardia sp. MH-G8]OZM79142.1 gas vesicle synthesis GvpLGvpF [Pseudonocardia sp. MH-G8]
MTATYVYGLVGAGAQLPDDLTGLGPSGKVSTIVHRDVAAIVGDVPADRPLGTRDDLLAHEAVVDTVASSTAVLPMRFPAVVEEEGVVEELLAPHHDRFVTALGELEGRVQYTLKGRYEQDVVLREVLEADPEIRQLQAEVRDLPEDATYHQRLRLGELVVGALEERRDTEAEQLVTRLEPYAVGVVEHHPGQPDDVVHAAFLVERERAQEFEDAVEEQGEQLHGRARLRLLGPLAPYDFVPGDEQ